jgi:hypothetical protein
MITRENYEEFFLSYVDDELPVTVRAAVDQFVADNPDLGPELEALLQCRIAPDRETGFINKDSLFQYESSLLSYIDGELEQEERISVEEWVRRNPRAGDELRQLQLTVSQPDPAIVFPGKESLYHGQRRRSPIVLFWLRAGVAAAVLAGVAFLLLPRQQNRGIVIVAPKIIPPAVTSAPPSTLHLVKKDNGSLVKNHQARLVTTVKKKIGQREEVTETPSVVLPAVKNQVAIVDPQPLKERALKVEQTSLSTTVAAGNIPIEHSFATQALRQRELEDSTNNSIAEASATPARNKFRGLFRKVSRAFGTTAERDSDGQRQVLIGAFQVALK